MAARGEVTGRKAGQPRKSKRTPQQAHASPEPIYETPVERQSFSVEEFCRRHGFSRAHYYVIRKLGLAPKEMHVHGRVLISKEAEAAWRREREESGSA